MLDDAFQLQPGLGSNTYRYLYLYLYSNTQISVFVFVFEKPQDEIFVFVFVFVFDWRIWVYLKNIFQIHFSFLHFNTYDDNNKYDILLIS